MSAIKKILCAVDLSEPSRLAMEEAAYLAKSFRAELLLLHVEATPTSVTGDIGAVPPVLFEEMRHELGQKLEGWRVEAAKQAEMPVQASLLYDHHPAAEIVRFAKEGEFDLIVLATHGRTGLKHLLLGSVAERVVREAHCRVLVVRRS